MYIFIGAIIVLVAALVLVFILTKKDVILKVEEDEFRFQNKGTHFKIFVNGNMLTDIEGATLFHGETYKISNNEKEYDIHVKSNYFGNKLYANIYKDGVLIATNKIEKNKAKK